MSADRRDDRRVLSLFLIGGVVFAGLLVFVALTDRFAGGSSALDTSGDGSAGQLMAPGPHPQEAYLSRPAGVPVGTLGSSTSREPEILQRIRAARLVATVGEPGDDTDVFFGGLAGAVIDARDRIFVLDSRLNEVRVLSSAGGLLETFGGAGQGPGEFAAPVSVALNRDVDRLYVGDRSSKVHVFSVAGDTSEYLESISLDGSVPDGLCVLGDELVVGSGDFPNGVIRVHDAAGQLSREFGRLYASPHFVVNGQLADVVLACDTANEQILVAAESLGEVRSFNPTGDVSWIQTADGFRSIVVTPVDPTHASVAIPEQGFHTFDSMLLISERLVVAQYTDWKREARGRSRRGSVSFAIATDSGESWRLDDDMPRILAVSDRLMVVEEPALDPHVGIYELGELR